MSNATYLKKENIKQVVHAIINNELISVPKIAQVTELTGATVHGITSKLEAQGVLSKCGYSSSNGGRKAQLYTLNKDYKYLVGISIRTNKIAVGIFDFKMNLICKSEAYRDLGEKSVEETIHHIYSFLDKTIKESRVDHNKIASIGINVPGPVDYLAGKVIALRGYPKWHNINLAYQLKQLVGIPVYIDKDVSSGLLLIKQIYKCQDNSNVLYISIDGGIGASIMTGGQIYRGNHGVAGEIGHTTVQQNGERCNCGNIGCLELVSSDYAIIRKSKKILGIPDKQNFSIDDAIQKYKEGCSEINDVFIEATMYLATTIRNSFMIYDPDDIYIRCKWLEFNKTLLFKLIDELYDNNTLIDRGDVKISLIQEENFVLRSAAIIAWNNELHSIDTSFDY